MHPLAPPPPFVPAPGLANPIAQTLFGVIARRPPGLPVRRERLETPDGDFIEIDVLEPAPGASPRGALVLVHGLEGSSRSPYMRSMLALAHERCIIGYALNFRSCGGAENRRIRTYHSGETGDLGHLVRTVLGRHPGAPLVVAGFSLGGNVTLKWLAEGGDALPPEVRGAVAVSCPYDLALCANHLDQPRNAWMRHRFLNTLRRKALAKARQFPGLVDEGAVRRSTTFRAFDDVFSGPIHGFRDADDYWTRASSGPLLGAIARPALLISAEDDPLIPPACHPREAARLNPRLSLRVTSHGGHVGFVGGTLLKPRFWAEERAIEWVEGLLGS